MLKHSAIIKIINSNTRTMHTASFYNRYRNMYTSMHNNITAFVLPNMPIWLVKKQFMWLSSEPLQVIVQFCYSFPRCITHLVSSPDRFFPFLFGDGVTKQKRKKAVWGTRLLPTMVIRLVQTRDRRIKFSSVN